MCPFVDNSDVRCATHLTLANLTRAFAHCADEYAVCPIYRQLARESIRHDCRYQPTAAARPLLVAS